MKRLPTNILVPVDGSKHMEDNIAYACDLAKNMDSKLTLIHVVILPTVVGPGLMTPTVTLPSFIDPKPFEEAGLMLLQKAKEIAKKNGVDPDTKLARTLGNPAQEILEGAETGKFDLIVIGAKGHSLIRNMTVGSVCDTVVHNAPCPVLVLHHQQ